MSSHFQKQLEVGRKGENKIAHWLRGRGNNIIPIYEIESKGGKGPRLLGQSKDYVAPDLLVFSPQGTAYWIETKHKTSFAWYRIGKRWVTGIDLRHYEEYKRVAVLTRIQVYLLFYHPSPIPSQNDLAYGCPRTCPTGLFGGELEHLSKNEDHRSSKWGSSGMVYWHVDTLKRYADTLGDTPDIKKAA